MLSALSGTEWIGAGLIAAATIVGALMGRWSARYSAISLAAVAGLLLVVVFGDLIPDIADDLRGSGPGWWIAAALAGCASFAAAGVVLRRGCACGARAGGGAAALAIGVHRALEGSALAVTTSIPVIAALVLHAGSEGFAIAPLFGVEQRRRTATWLLVACVSPVVGAAVLGALHVPESATPILTALVAGVLARSAVEAGRLAMADEVVPALRQYSPQPIGSLKKSTSAHV
ncbi:MAG TPA: hypothetical protein VGH85_21925 [Mycobacteriales bacterium]|jgi:ZIP family zinc transporter